MFCDVLLLPCTRKKIAMDFSVAQLRPRVWSFPLFFAQAVAQRGALHIQSGERDALSGFLKELVRQMRGAA